MTAEEAQMYLAIANVCWWIALGSATMIVIVGCLALYSVMR